MYSIQCIVSTGLNILRQWLLTKDYVLTINQVSHETMNYIQPLTQFSNKTETLCFAYVSSNDEKDNIIISVK